jgi:aryl-alcohol dehydrogenase-like predicted oxidoreductase
MTMPELALRFIPANPDVATIIPGMRKRAHLRRAATRARATRSRSS